MRFSRAIPAAVLLALAAGTLEAAPTRATNKSLETPADNSALEKAAELVANTDSDRLFEDPAYAREVLAALETLRASRFYSGEMKSAIDRGRVVALMAAGRDRDAFDLTAQLSRAEPGDFDLHYFAFLTGSFVDPTRTVEELERAHRHLSSAQDRSRFRSEIDEDAVHRVRASFTEKDDEAGLARLAEALLGFGWPGEELIGLGDALRLDALDGRLARGDTAGAKALASAIRSPRAVLRLLVDRRYDDLVAAGDPLARIQTAIAGDERRTAALLAAKPNDPRRLIDRAQHLRSVGREADALALLLPKTRDMAAVKAMGEDGFWIVNEAAYALLALDRASEAVALMDRLVALGLRENEDLISMAINRSEILLGAGRYRDAADYAVSLFSNHSNLASPYGHMWMWSSAACGHLLAGDAKAAQPWLDRLRKGERDNPAATMRGHLCANDLGAAASAIIGRLNGDDPASMLVALQDYRVQEYRSPARKLVEARLNEVARRADVQAAIARRGRVLKLPLSRIYWGTF